MIIVDRVNYLSITIITFLRISGVFKAHLFFLFLACNGFLKVLIFLPVSNKLENYIKYTT